MVEGFEGVLLVPPGSSCEEEVLDLAVMRVFTTQMGLVIRTVALPARAPASIDSTVVSLEEARPALMAARSKAARVHSYPGVGWVSVMWLDEEWRVGRTVIVHEICDANAEESRVQAGV